MGKGGSVGGSALVKVDVWIILRRFLMILK